MNVPLQVCRRQYDHVTSSNINRRSARFLSQDEKFYLRPEFGNLVDRIEVTYGANLPDGITILGKTWAVPADAMTFGSKMYFRQHRQVDAKMDVDHILLLAHELVHSAQYERFGNTIDGFCGQYATGYTGVGGWNYFEIPLEREAQDRTFKFAQKLGRRFTSGCIQHIEHEHPNNFRTTPVPCTLKAIERHRARVRLRMRAEPTQASGEVTILSPGQCLAIGQCATKTTSSNRRGIEDVWCQAAAGNLNGFILAQTEYDSRRFVTLAPGCP